MPITVHRLPVCDGAEALYDAGVKIIERVGDQAMAQRMPPPHLAALLSGLFAGALSGLQGLSSEQQIREFFDGCLAAYDEEHNKPSGVH